MQENTNRRFPIPILLISFNRPENTRAVLNQIRKVQPIELYMAFDGPRLDKKGEVEKCNQCRSVVDEVDWDCSVHTLFREKNVGCGFGPSGAISWAFESANQLIILEDDCLPSVSFFYFCEEMLTRYKGDKRVWIVSGLSIHPNSKFFNGKDYLFSHYAHTWGWATWKNRWNEFDLYMHDVPEFLETGGALNICDSKSEANRINKKLKRVYSSIDEEVKHSWDTQWDYARLKNNSIDIVPRVNLIQNVGAVGGTHESAGGLASNLVLDDFQKEIKHPLFITRNKPYDLYHYSHYVHPSFFRLIGRLLMGKANIWTMLSILLSKLKK